MRIENNSFKGLEQYKIKRGLLVLAGEEIF